MKRHSRASTVKMLCLVQRIPHVESVGMRIELWTLKAKQVNVDDSLIAAEDESEAAFLLKDFIIYC